MHIREGILFGSVAAMALSSFAMAAHVPTSALNGRDDMARPLHMHAIFNALATENAAPRAHPRPAGLALWTPYTADAAMRLTAPPLIGAGHSGFAETDPPPVFSAPPAMMQLPNPFGDVPMASGPDAPFRPGVIEGPVDQGKPVEPNIVAVPLPTPLGFGAAGLLAISAVRRRRLAC
ncbi:MAG: hypothetical protein EA379_09630 [Phycisphaerales bacterium]|nr:MAG: hypothetical protein EA379_09630 [Phycisphaerales bacterium]